MKKKVLLLLVVVLSLFSTNLFSQVSFSCDYREYCYWNDRTEVFEDCEGYEESSLFTMNEAETMFHHTIESMKSSYYVSDSEYNEENDVYTYYVKSDVGNEYYYVFDINNKEVRAMYSDDNGNPVMIRFYVKAIF